MINYDFESALANATILESAGFAALAAVILRFLYSILTGQIPGDGIIPAIVVGGLMGAMLHIFKSGILG
ncbi:MAG: hypothetical protein AAFV19_09875 [Pseudomonadota bacterium]